MVNSLKPEFEGKITFALADLSTKKGSAFGRAHNVGSVTLILFHPDGSKIATISGLRDEAFYRRAFNRAFKLN